MKKLILSLLAVTALFASCTKEQNLGFAGEETLVTFELTTPEIGTKAIGDGTTATALYYAVYDDAGNKISGLGGTATLSNLKSTVSMTLVNGKEYSLIFFAKKLNESAVSADFDSKTMSFNPSLANKESYDAFWAYVEPFTVTGPINKTVELKRPFAQLNIGTSDYNAYEKAGGTAFTEVAVGVQTVYNTMNLVTGDVSGNVAAAYASAAFPTESFPVATSPANKYLAMNYVLVGEEKQVVDVTLTYAGQTQTYTNVPVQRNYRTNIYGTLLTNSANFNVEIKPGLGGPNDVEVLEPVVNDLSELNTALASNTTNNNITYTVKGCSAQTDAVVDIPDTFVASHVTFNFIDLSAGANLTINGANFANDATIMTPAGVKLGTLTINIPNAHVNVIQGSFTSVSSNTSSTTLVIGSNVEIGELVVDGGSVEIEAGADITSLEAGDNNNDPIVVYVEDNEDMPEVKEGTTVIKADAESKNESIAEGNVIKLTEDVTLNTIWVLDSDVVLDGNGHTLTSTAARAINVSGANNVTIKNLTIDASGERAINIIQNTKNVTIENVTATASNYTVNIANSAPGAVVSINKSTLKGLNVVNVAAAEAEVTVTNSTINCDDDNTTVGESYAALCLNKDAKGGKIIATGCTINLPADSDSVKARNGAENGTVTIDGKIDDVQVIVAYIGSGDYYYSFSTLASAVEYANAEDVITLIRDIELSEMITVKKNITIDLNGRTITGTDTTTKNFSLIDNRGTLKVMNGTITLVATTNSGWDRYSAVLANNPGGNLTVSNVTLEHLGGTDMAYGIDNLTNGKGTSAITTIESSTIKSKYRAVRQFLNGIEATNELYVKSGSKLEGANKGIFFHDPNKNANPGKVVVEEGAKIGTAYLSVTEGSTEWPVEVSIAESAVDKDGVTSKNVPEGYEVKNIGGIWTVVKVVSVNSQEELEAALKDPSIETIYLGEGKYVPSLYPGDIPTRKSLTIVGSGADKTQFAYTGSNYAGQFGLAGFDSITIRNCEVLKRENVKEWGMIVFGSSNNANGVYTFENCTFNGVGTQGIYINEKVSGATYNILNCIFNGDFGSEGAITIENNNGVNHIVNVNGCTFSNIPASSHKIFVHFAYEGWKLNTDVAESDVYWKANQ